MWAIFVRSFRLVSWGLKCLPPVVDVRPIDWGSKGLPPICRYWVAWLGFEVSLPVWRCLVVWLEFEVSPPICRCLVVWLGFEMSLPICRYWVIWLGFEVSCKSNMGLWCCSSEVSSMLIGFNTVIGVTSLELELLAWVLGLGSLCSLPSDLDQILP